VQFTVRSNQLTTQIHVVAVVGLGFGVLTYFISKYLTAVQHVPQRGKLKQINVLGSMISKILV